MEEIGAGAFSKSAPWSVDLSEAVNLKTIAPDAFPFASPWGDDQCYIFVANEAVLAKMPTTFPARIFTRVVQIDRSTPIASVQIRAAQGKDIERILPGIGSYAEGRVVGMDVGDGKIRLLALSSLRYSSNEPSYYGARSMQWLRSAVADPEIKIYGTDFDCFRSPWAVVTQLDLLRATQLKKIDLLYIPQSLLPDLASYPNLERLSLSKISGLERLDLSHTPLKGLEISSCDTLQAVILPPSGLERLSITRCKKLTQIDEAPLASVKELNLSYNALGGTLNLSGAKHLKEVDLSSNQLTELTIDNPLLTDLKCSRNQLKAIHTPTTREAFQGVRSVAIASNRIQESELNRLYTALPDLKEETTAGKLTLLSKIATTEQDNNAYASDLSIAREKNWKFYDLNGQEMTSMIVKADTLVSWNNATGDVELPASIRVISKEAFVNNPTITSIKGENVEECYGITQCDKLTKVDFPKLRHTWLSARHLDTHPGYTSSDEEMILKGGAYFSTEVAGNPNGSLPTIAFTSCPLLETVVGADGILFYYSKSKAVGKVTLDPSIKTISYGAFDGCKQMTELEAMGVTAIYARAFLDCSELAKVTLPALQHTQGNPFWQDCPKLQEVKSPQGIWLDRKATGTVIIPDGVEFIAVNAYRGQTAVTALQFPSSLRRIGQYAFSRTGITSMPSLEGITEIHPGAFLRCTSLAGALNVPSSVTLLGEKAFAHCSSLTSASIEASIGSVPNFLFDGCDALNEVSMGSTIVTCNLFWGHSQPYEKPTAPQKLILHAPVKAQYRICAPQGSRDPRKTLDVYVPAPLLEEYKNRDHYESAYSFAYDNYTYYAMESSATEATVTITQVAGCTIVVKNGEQEIPSGSSLPIGTKLTIYAQLESGKLLKKFFFNGANMGSINRYDLTLTEPMTFSAEVVATFTQIPEYVVRFTSTGHGHLTATKNGEPFTSGSLARKNDKLVITAHPDAGYNVDKWLLGSEEIELSVYTGRTVFETTVGEAEVIVKTTFVAKTFPVTVAESPNGKVTVSGYDDLTAVPYGTRLMVTATPDEGYTLHKITANGQDITDAKSFEVKEATTIQAEFVEQIKTFPVTVAESPNGKVTVSGYDDLTAVPYGTRLTVTATPDKGYTLHKITANGQDITDAESFEVKEATTIQAEFNKDTALEEVTTEQIVLYPNPVKDMVFLTGGMAYAPVAIYSLEGVCLLLTETDAEGKACIHVEGLVEGAYLVKIGAKSFPLIVVH